MNIEVFQIKDANKLTRELDFGLRIDWPKKKPTTTTKYIFSINIKSDGFVLVKNYRSSFSRKSL